MDHLAAIASFSEPERKTLLAMLDKGINASVTTSAGRLFDGVSALLGLRQRNGYEGQAACMLEWAINGEECGAYEFAVTGDQSEWIVDWVPALQTIVEDLEAGIPVSQISAKFHAGLAKAIADVATRIGVETVMLTGGCFQNKVLTESAVDTLEQAGHHAYWHEAVPPGDGGLALGQAYWAARMIGAGELPCA
jgi:hydrogenase maturation protein HypF